MSDGEFGPTYQEVRYLNKLTSSEIADAVIDQHLEEAFEEVQSALKTKFSISTITFTDYLFNTKDLFFGKSGTLLYFSEFYDPDNNIVLPLLTVTALSYKGSESSAWDEYDEGWDDDYRLMTRENMIRFNEWLSRDGYQNLRISGTCGHTYSAMTDMEEKFKKYIALLAAIRGIVYSAGSSYNEAKGETVGAISTSVSEFSSTQTNTFKQLQEQLKFHIARHGLAGKKLNMCIV
jgi:hypothetical protein